MSDKFKSVSGKFGSSTPTTRNIDTLRRMALRLESGQSLENPSQLNDIADDMERIYAEMIRRHFMGHEGANTGLVDRNDNPIYIGSKLRFDRKEWGNDNNVFTVKFEDGELCGFGTPYSWSQWCEVIPKEEV